MYALKALTHRNLKAMGSGYKDAIINSLAMALLWSINGKYLLPAVGLNPAIAGPMFIGSLIFTFFEVTFNRGIAFVFDVHGPRTLNFYMTLPYGIIYFLLAHMISLSLEIIALSLPALILGKIILGSLLTIQASAIPSFILVYVLSTFFFAGLTLAISLSSSISWFLHSNFAQCIGPMAFLGCMDVPWTFISTTFPTLRWIFVISPATYVTEGLRRTLLGHDTFALWLCIGMILFYTALTLAITWYALRKKYDYI